jgi:hypothetical protein
MKKSHACRAQRECQGINGPTLHIAETKECFLEGTSDRTVTTALQAQDSQAQELHKKADVHPKTLIVEGRHARQEASIVTVKDVLPGNLIVEGTHARHEASIVTMIDVLLGTLTVIVTGLAVCAGIDEMMKAAKETAVIVHGMRVSVRKTRVRESQWILGIQSGPRDDETRPHREASGTEASGTEASGTETPRVHQEGIHGEIRKMMRVQISMHPHGVVRAARDTQMTLTLTHLATTAAEYCRAIRPCCRCLNLLT